MKRLSFVSAPLLPVTLVLLLPLCLAGRPAAAQDEIVTEGMITPKDATVEAEIVVVQMSEADRVPGPPLVLPTLPRTLVLSSQSTPTGGTSPLAPVAQSLGRLPAAEWRVWDYGIDWPGSGGQPSFEGFSDVATFRVTRGEVFPVPLQPVSGQSLRLRVEGPWENTCTPEIEGVAVDSASSTVVVDARRTDTTCLPADGRPGRFEADVPVAPLAAGRWEVEVRVPTLDEQSTEIYATGSLRVVPPGEPRVADVKLQPDPERDAQLILVDVEVPTVPSGGGCASWNVTPRNAWAHGRDLYARFELEETAAACGATTTSTWSLPLPDLETGHYRLVVQREIGASGAELWAQSPKLVETQQLGQLIDDRFRVTATWRTSEGSGRGFPVATEDGSSAIFAFFGDDNWELLVKVLDGCFLNGHYWVFASASTDVEYTLVVEDTATGDRATYQNPLGQASPAITDTRALATCE